MLRRWNGRANFVCSHHHTFMLVSPVKYKKSTEYDYKCMKNFTEKKNNKHSNINLQYRPIYYID